MNKKILYGMLYMFFLLLVCRGVVRGAENDPLLGVKENIVRVQSVCKGENSDIYSRKEFTGLLIPGNGSDVYVITINNGLEYSAGELEVIKAENQLDEKKSISVFTEVVTDGDLHIPASIVNGSPQRNISILHLEQSIVLKNTPEFSPETASQGDKVKLLYYPMSNASTETFYDSENVAVAEGTITGEEIIGEVSFLHHDIPAIPGAAGGPLLDENGYLTGMLLDVPESAGMAISGDEMKKMLDLFGIGYSVHQEVKAKKFSKVHLILAIAIIIMMAIVLIQFIRTSVSGKKSRTKEKRLHKGNDRARLLILSQKRTVPIEKTELILGSGSEADLILPKNKGTSRKHAVITLEGNKFYLTDLESLNGTFINGKQIAANKKTKLRDGSRIRLGEEEIVFRS